MREPPYFMGYGKFRMWVHSVVTNKYFDAIIAAVIGLNVVTMSLEYYEMPMELDYALKLFNFVFTGIFMFELIMKLYALGVNKCMSERWNRLDVLIVIMSLVGILLEEMESNLIPINPTIIRVMRVARIARVLKLLKMARGMRALLNTVMQALPQVGNLGLLFFLLFFIFAALGVELFGRLECDEDKYPCQGMSEHAHFQNFGIAFLTLFRVATGDNWNGIMKDTLRDECDDSVDCVKNCCVNHVIAPLYFVVFVLLAQFVLVNVVVAVLMKHLEESHKYMEEDEDYEIDLEIQRELEEEKKVMEMQETQMDLVKTFDGNAVTSVKEQTAAKKRHNQPRHLHKISKVNSLPANFTITLASEESDFETNPGLEISGRRATIRMKESTSCLAASDFTNSRAKQQSRSSHHKQQLNLHSPVSPKLFDDDNSSFNNLSPTTTKEGEERKYSMYSETGMSIMDEESASQYLTPSYPEFCHLNIITKSVERKTSMTTQSKTLEETQISLTNINLTTERKSINSTKSWDQVSWMGQKDGSSLSSISTDNSMTMDVERVICYREQPNTVETVLDNKLVKDDSQEESQVDNELLSEIDHRPQSSTSKSPKHANKGCTT